MLRCTYTAGHVGSTVKISFSTCSEETKTGDIHVIRRFQILSEEEVEKEESFGLASGLFTQTNTTRNFGLSRSRVPNTVVIDPSVSSIGPETVLSFVTHEKQDSFSARCLSRHHPHSSLCAAPSPVCSTASSFSLACKIAISSLHLCSERTWG